MQNSNNEEFKDPFGCAKFGRYQKIVSFLVLLMTIKFFWGGFFANHLDLLDQIKCAEPQDVVDYCSEDCKQIGYKNQWFGENYITEYRWFCSKEFMIHLKSWVDFSGLILGSVFWIPFERKFGKRWTILAGACLSLCEELVLCFYSHEILFLIGGCIHTFAGMGYFVQGTNFLAEILPFSSFHVIVIVAQCAICLDETFSFFFWYLGRNWLWFQMGEVFLTIVIGLGSLIVTETPRWYIRTGRTDEASQVMEKISKINREPTEGIREKIEKAWRDTRTHPASQDNLRGMFRYSLLRDLYLKYSFLMVTSALGHIITLQLIPPTVVDDIKALKDAIYPTISFLCLLIWYQALKIISLRNNMIHANYGVLVSFFLLYFNQQTYTKLVLCILSFAFVQIMKLCVHLYLLQFIPASLRSIALELNLILFMVGVQLSNVLLRIKKFQWLIGLVTLMFFFIGLFVAQSTVDTKYLPQKETIRDAELHLRGLLTNSIPTRMQL